jgi:hypothetical protein
MRTKAMTWLAALALLTLAPLAAQEAGFESETTQPVEAEATTEAPAEPVAPEAVDLSTAEVPEPAIEETEPALEESATEEPAAESSLEPMAEESAEELPRTASPLALLALLGLGSTASALGLRSARRR